mgnify:FL=1
MAVLFTSDTHFFHNNVLRFDNRPWNTMEDMCNEMLKRWNSKVSKDDTVYILGDYTWKQGDEHIEFLKKLNGHKRLVLGNHDFRNASRKYKDLFEAIKDYDDIKVTLQNGEVKRCILSHYFMPFYNAHYYGSILLHGHSHNTKEHYEELRIAKELNDKGFTNQIYNVGCMLWNYEPVTLDEILTGGEKDKN